LTFDPLRVTGDLTSVTRNEFLDMFVEQTNIPHLGL
jgi:hypothetical protein